MGYPTPPAAKMAYRLLEASQVSSIARSTIYFLVNSGELPTFKVGKTTLILHEDLVGLLQERANTTKRTRKKRANGTKRTPKK